MSRSRCLQQGEQPLKATALSRCTMVDTAFITNRQFLLDLQKSWYNPVTQLG